MHTTDAKLKPRLNEYICKQYINNALKTIKIPFNLLILNSCYFIIIPRTHLNPLEWDEKAKLVQPLIP